MDELTVREFSSDGRTVIESVGEITVLNVRPLREAVTKLQGCDTDAVLDLRGISYIDSAGIEQLVAAYQSLRKRGRKLIVVVNPGTQPENVLEAVALHTFATLARDASEYGLGGT